ncbi:MAG: hypothetical protein KJ721_00700 [Nanoarchaeota archaeon]|nr:hypothetical protein [Nanoarchaeota archaeon]
MNKEEGFLLVIIILLCGLTLVSAQISSSNYNITSYVISGGGTNTTSDNYKTDFVLGSITGNITSSLYKAFFGFFYAAGEGNTAPNTPSPNLVSVDGTNQTYSDLNCSATISDANGDAMNVTVRWYKNGGVNLTLDYNNSYSNNTLFSAILDSGNTTKGQNWICSLRLYDGISYSSWGNSSNLIIGNTLPIVTLLSPEDGNITTNRTPEFRWNEGTDEDGDNLTYDLNITCYPGCSVGNRLYSGISELNKTLTNYLQYLKDNNFYYNWTVRANDGFGDGPWATPRKIEIQAEVDITLLNNTIAFGALNAEETSNTTDDSPLPFLIQNDGNCFTNVSINASNLWTSVANPSDYFKYKIDNKSGEEGSFNWLQSNTIWTQVPNTTQLAIAEFNWSDATDSAEIDLLVTAPAAEGAGDKSSTVYFTASLGE